MSTRAVDHLKVRQQSNYSCVFFVITSKREMTPQQWLIAWRHYGLQELEIFKLLYKLLWFYGANPDGVTDTVFSCSCGILLKSKDGCSSKQLRKISDTVFIFLTHAYWNFMWKEGSVMAGKKNLARQECSEATAVGRWLSRCWKVDWLIPCVQPTLSWTELNYPTGTLQSLFCWQLYSPSTSSEVCGLLLVQHQMRFCYLLL